MIKDVVHAEVSAARLELIQGLVLRPGARDVALFGAYTNGQLAALVRGLAENSKQGRRVGLVTGAFMAWAHAAETDGPVGVAALAMALVTVGAQPVIVTDEPCRSVVRACLDVVGLGREMLVVPVDVTEAAVADMVADADLAQLIAVERLGPNANGQVLTMAGVDVTAHTAPLHAAFKKTQAVTGSIGDGGNELGMANLPIDVIAEVIDNGRAIASTIRVDHLVPAGTSNWGCYAVIAGLALLAPEHATALGHLLDPAMDEKLLAAATAVGGIDGVKGKPGNSIDGVSVENYRGLMLALKGLARSAPE